MKLYTVYDHITHKIIFLDATVCQAAKYLKVSIHKLIDAADKDIWLFNRYEFCVEEWPNIDINEIQQDREGYLKKIDNFKKYWDLHIYRGTKLNSKVNRELRIITVPA